jgi:hypothetical protein
MVRFLVPAAIMPDGGPAAAIIQAETEDRNEMIWTPPYTDATIESGFAAWRQDSDIIHGNFTA